MSHQELDPREGSIEMHTGCWLYWRTNAAGGRTYTSDEIPTGVEVWDTCLTDMATLCEAISMEFALIGVERRAAEREKLTATAVVNAPVVRPADEGPCPNCGALGCWTPCPVQISPLPEGVIVFDGDTLPDELRRDSRPSPEPLTHEQIALRIALRRARLQLLRYSKTDPVARDIEREFGSKL